MTADIPKIATGVPGLDELLHGGIPKGRATLVTGRSGTGKTVLALQVAAALARNGMPVIFVAVEETPEDLRSSADAMRLDYSGLLAADKLCFADATRLDGSTIVAGEYDLEGLGHRLEALAGQIGARALVLDSATALFSPRPPLEALRSHFFQLVAALRSLNLTSIILAEAPQDYGQLTTLGVEDYVCDLTLILRNIVDGSRRRRTLEANKYRRSAHYKGEYPCTITPKGLAVFPVETEGAMEHPLSGEVERFSSGVAGLDEMTHGGWLRNSIIIVRGQTGSGKTLLAGVYAHAGAGRGERVVYYGFEETRPLLLRNYREIGMDLEPYVQSGRLRVICRYAEATSLEDLLVDVRLELEDHKPSLIVFDSISSIEHSSSPRGFRQFMVGLASILRQHGRTALMTQTIAADHAGDEHRVPYLSTIADAILLLDYSMTTFEMERELRVVKTRGSGHETRPYHLSMEPGGLRVTQMALAKARER